LVIEIDGSQHSEEPHAARDRQRDEYLSRLGLLIIRVNSRQVLKETDAVVEFIYQKVEERTPNPPKSPFSKGGL
jgi:very-short-patch-repair endonuclease